MNPARCAGLISGVPAGTGVNPAKRQDVIENLGFYKQASQRRCQNNFEMDDGDKWRLNWHNNVMLLHRYLNSHAFETLKDAKLKTSRIGSFNDPFEFLYVSHFERMTPELARRYIRSQRNNPAFLLYLGLEKQQSPNPLSDAEIEKHLDKNEPSMTARLVAKWPDIAKESELTIERRRQIIDRELRAVCFSDPSRVKPLDEILLWSHYAKKHKGIRIGFEFPEGIKGPFEIMEMKYRKDRVVVNLAFWADIETVQKGLEESAKIKSEAWGYEHEFRLFTKIADSPPNEEHFLDISREWIKSVDFGVLCPEAEIQRVVELLKKDYPKVIYQKAEFHKTEFALEYKRVH